MSHNNGRAEEDALKQQALSSQAAAQAAQQKAETPDPLTQMLRDRVTKVLNWSDGTSGPPDVRAFPDQAGMSLYNDAKKVTDAGRVGKGYGTLSDGANPAFATALDKENTIKRGEAASGALENYVDNSINAATGEAASLGAEGNATSMAIAQMLNSDSNAAQNRYVQYLSRPKQPSFLSQLASGVLGAGTGFLTGGFSGLLGGGGGDLNQGGLDSIDELSI